MPQFWIEGIYLNKQGVKKARRSGKAPSADIEPFARAFWAETAEEAIAQATEALEGGEWLEGPHLSRKTEEQRMRAAGAPELPGFGLPTKARPASKAKR